VDKFRDVPLGKYGDEECPNCGALFAPHHHFIRCAAKPCPMVSTKDPRSFLEKFVHGDPSLFTGTLVK